MKTSHKIILVCLLLVVVGWSVLSYVKNQQQQLVSATTEKIIAQQTRLELLSKNLAANALPDDMAVISDCPLADRVRFDDLLGKLSTLSWTELNELDNLFGNCAYYYADIRTFKSAWLKREVAVYTDLLETIAPIDDQAQQQLDQATQWSELVAKVDEQAGLTRELVDLQQEIIDQLLGRKNQHQH